MFMGEFFQEFFDLGRVDLFIFFYFYADSPTVKLLEGIFVREVIAKIKGNIAFGIYIQDIAKFLYGMSFAPI